MGHSPRGRTESDMTEHTQNEETWLTKHLSGDLEASSQMLILPVLGPAALSRLLNINFSHL